MTRHLSRAIPVSLLVFSIMTMFFLAGLATPVSAGSHDAEIKEIDRQLKAISVANARLKESIKASKAAGEDPAIWEEMQESIRKNHERAQALRERKKELLGQTS